MKINQNTLDILKNFSEINTNILIKPEAFDSEFGIYDLNEFLAVVSSTNKPELKLEDKFMTISAEGSKSKVKYFYSDPSVIVSPVKEVNMPEADVTFSLSQANLLF